MNWTHTPQSSNVAAIAHDPNTRTLHVRFKSGHTYTYANVSADAHDDLVNADSVGKHLQQHIIGAHEHRRIS
jgi:hypothetical protein